MKLASQFPVAELLLVLLPLLSSILHIFIKCNTSRQLISVFSICVSCLLSLIVFAGFQNSYCYDIANWISIGEFNAKWSICIDRISSILCVIVTLVSAVVHIYSLGYMSDDENKGRFFSYLSLFTFFMLALVTSKNFLQLFFGWEGVGLCSYLLIGFWFHKYPANQAALKAFVVNRFADVFFILAIIAIFTSFNTLNIDDVSLLFASKTFVKTLPVFNVNTIDAVCILILIGCMGKSAQVGFHIWLPDAMEGPTPISALIHAATMVAAGVFMIVKCSFLFEGSPIARHICLIVGAITCISSALIGLAQSDIKKVIAYSTCSQLGYMFMACGSSNYNAGLFHLSMHAFFKALLFLCAGNVIHSFHGEQNIYKMGGNCFKNMKFTYILFWIGSLALSGFFPFSGFYSKDLIIEGLYHQHFLSFLVGVFVAFLTALYSFKLIVLVFHRPKNEIPSGVHESKSVMLVPLALLAILSMFTGFLYSSNIVDGEFWQHSIYFVHHSQKSSINFGLVTSLASILGAVLAYVLYSRQKSLTIIPSFVTYVFERRLYIDEIYNMLLIVPYKYISALSSYIIEKAIDFSIPAFLGNSSVTLGRCSLRLHCGNMKLYESFAFFTCLFGLAFVCFLFF